MVLLVHEGLEQRQAVHGPVQSSSGALVDTICLPLMSEDMKEKLLKTQTERSRQPMDEDSPVSQDNGLLEQSREPWILRSVS